MASKAALASIAILLSALVINFIPSSSTDAPAPGSSPCPVATVNAIADVCLNVFSNSTAPSGDCCGLLSVVADVGVCLCDVLKILSVNVDVSVVVKLLDSCENNNNVSSDYTCSKS